MLLIGVNIVIFLKLFRLKRKKFIHDKVMEIDLPWSEKDVIDFLRSGRRDWVSFIKGKTKNGAYVILE